MNTDTTSAEDCHRAEKVDAWLVDMDGTLALNDYRNPYDWRDASNDAPNLPVIAVVQALAHHSAGAAIVVVSGRHEAAREITIAWLDANSVSHDNLLMRADDDYRPDDVVKEEMFHTRIKPHYRVIGVIDDRDRVVRMWRRLGLTCFQVAEGDF